MPKQDSLQKFVALRSALEREQAVLQKRLREIDQVLGSRGPAPVAPASAAGRPRKTAAPRRTGRRGSNAVSLRDAITRVTAKAPLSVRDIVDAVKKGGYTFQSTNPVNSVGAYLYGPEGKKHFKRANGKFSPK